MRRQQLAQLRRLVWFARDGLLDALGEAQRDARDGARRRLELEDRPRLAEPQRPSPRGQQRGEGEGQGEGQQQQRGDKAFLVLPLGGRAAGGGSSGGAANGGSGSSPTKGDGSSGAAATNGSSGTSGSGSDAPLQLHMCSTALLDELLDGARFARAAYGYVVAAGHMSSFTGALKLLATMPLFDPIAGGRAAAAAHAGAGSGHVNGGRMLSLHVSVTLSIHKQ
jgi:hypothetical protein